MKTLYFEGAGSVPRGMVENCRIRTAFKNDNGESIYLEMSGFEVTKNSVNSVKKFTIAGIVDHCHYIFNDDDCNKHGIISMRHKTFEYSKDEILSIVNSLGCSFNEVVILPDLAGYRVFKDREGHNFGDEFQFNAELTSRAEEIRAHFYALEKSEGKQYPNLSLWVDQDNKEMLHLLRHFNGYNKHWSITNSENWQESIVETVLGKCAC